MNDFKARTSKLNIMGGRTFTNISLSLGYGWKKEYVDAYNEMNENNFPSFTVKLPGYSKDIDPVADGV